MAYFRIPEETSLLVDAVLTHFRRTTAEDTRVVLICVDDGVQVVCGQSQIRRLGNSAWDHVLAVYDRAVPIEYVWEDLVYFQQHRAQREPASSRSRTPATESARVLVHP